MSFIQNFFTSRDNNANTQTYVGQTDRLWYDPDTNTLRVSDGSTPGGLPVDYSNGANIVANDITADTLTVNNITSTGGNISVTANLIITGNISPATDVKIGGIKAGPGANIANDGTLTIDTTGLPLSFGNFTANNNILSIVNVDENMILDTQGNAEIQLVGNIGFYKSNGGNVAPDPADLYFQASEDGQVKFLVPNTDPILGAVEIIGSSTGNSIAPGIVGAMLHVTGQLGDPCRLYYDGNGDYVSWVARRWNGNVANPTQVLAGEDVLRINATAATDLGGGNVGNVAMAQISVMALENQTATAQGSEISLTVTPVGQPATNRVEVANITVANGVTATKFTTAGTVTATGNIDGGNILTGGVVSATGNITGGNIAATNHTGTTVSVTGNIIGGNISTNGVISATGNITGGNIAATNHTGTTVSVTGNITGGNVRTAGQVSATGNITGGNVITGGVISAAGNITVGNVLTGGLISATGSITSGDDISDNLGSVRSIPQNGKSSNYQLQATDNGQMINITSGNVTVPAGVFVSPFGQAITIFNNQNSSNAIVQAANVTIRLAGTAATGNRTLARYGIATLVCVSANTFVISGAGLT